MGLSDQPWLDIRPSIQADLVGLQQLGLFNLVGAWESDVKEIESLKRELILGEGATMGPIIETKLFQTRDESRKQSWAKRKAV